jgi:hypothetical protein
MNSSKLAGVAGLVACFVAGSAAAEEQTLRFRLVVSLTNVSFAENSNAPGHNVGAGRAVGVAVFEDGRIAFKDFVIAQDGTEEEGTASGYSTYTFENGDSLTARFTFEWSPTGAAGDYQVLSGTGAFEGATGTGHFEGAQEPWKDAEMLEGSFTLDVPAM